MMRMYNNYNIKGIDIVSMPRLIIDLKKIIHNTKTIASLCKNKQINITGVTKACCGDPKIALAMIQGGATSLADSRLANIKRLKKSGIDVDLMMLRTPMISEVDELIEICDISLNSEYSVIEALSNSAKINDKVHDILIMLEMGDLREGCNIEEISTIIERSIKLSNVKIIGIAMNLACFSGVIPTNAKIKEFESTVKKLENNFNLSFSMISGGNSANIPLLQTPLDYRKINNFRIGEGILLGLETSHRNIIPGCFRDAFILEAEIIELKKKPSIPNGEITQNAFGETPTFQDFGIINRGILAIGRQDVVIEGLLPYNSDIKILGGSSDHLIINFDSVNFQVGDTIKFNIDYRALVRLYTSPYVEKYYIS